MKERPILFSTPMIQAILEGKKTMTRRIVKLVEFAPSNTPGYKYQFRDKRASWNDVTDETIMKFCPFGKVGDRLWVKETWTKVSVPDGTTARKLLTLYKASMPAHGIDSWQVKWKSSIFMPRSASRITLEITGIKVERLQEISEEDAKREGVESRGGIWWRNYHSKIDPPVRVDSAKTSFETLWESINGSGSWSANPWVWVIEFKRIK